MPYSDPEKQKEAKRRSREKLQAGRTKAAREYRAKNRGRNKEWRQSPEGKAISAERQRRYRAARRARESGT